jgi:hypothetical protein
MVVFKPRGIVYIMWSRVTLYENKYGHYAYLTSTDARFRHTALFTSRDIRLYYVELKLS